MVRQHHQLNGLELEQTWGDGEGQRSQMCCSPWGPEELDTTQRLNNGNMGGGCPLSMCLDSRGRATLLPLSVGLSGQEHWSELNLLQKIFPDPRIEPTSSASPALALQP